MRDRAAATIDFVRELRLRRWAREHWVVPDARKGSWHPVALDEMCLRDREMAADSNRAEPIQNNKAEPIQEEHSHERTTGIDIGSGVVCEGEMPPIRNLFNSEFADESINVGATYVPLAPTLNWSVDWGSSEISKPHDRREFRHRGDYAEPACPARFDSPIDPL